MGASLVCGDRATVSTYSGSITAAPWAKMGSGRMPWSVTTSVRRFLSLLVLLCSGCTVFYDEGARFADPMADFASHFRVSSETTATFEYVPLYGNSQHIRVGIGRIRFCPKPPCDGSWTIRLPSGEERTYYQGGATVWVERGKSGTGYRIASAASVPEPLAALPKPSDSWVKVVLMIGPHWKEVFTSWPLARKTLQMFWPP